MNLPFNYTALAEQPLTVALESLFFLVVALLLFQLDPFKKGYRGSDDTAEQNLLSRLHQWLRQQFNLLVLGGVAALIAILGHLLNNHFGLLAQLLFVLSLVWFALGLFVVAVLPAFWRVAATVVVFFGVTWYLLGLDLNFIAHLDAMKFPLGNITISAWGIIAGITTLVVLLWLAFGVAGFIEKRVRKWPILSPSLQVLLIKLVRTILLALAFIIAISSMGVDLTVLTVLGGAIGLGLGFGLQKIVSNFVCGFILLSDRSIKPGDVIEIGSTYGWINNLNARYVSVVTRDGTEHLIPNEDLVTQRVVNWSFTNNLIRVRTPVGISYSSDPHKAIEIINAVILKQPRILQNPPPNVLVTAFGDSSVDLEIRCWIADPVNGVGNIRSALLLSVWDAFKANGIEIPFPQRDLHIRSDFRHHLETPATEDSHPHA
jgi:small-conductance mechanosensitive channel